LSEAGDEFLAASDAVSVLGSPIEDFLRDRMGAEAYSYIQDEDDDIVTHLRGALARVVADELDEAAVLQLANACENFLIKLANEAVPAVDLTGASGIITKAERLKTASVIAQKQMGYMTFIGQLRNAADHGIDSDIGLDWAITPAAVKLGVTSLIAAVRSVVSLTEGRAEF